MNPKKSRHLLLDVVITNAYSSIERSKKRLVAVFADLRAHYEFNSVSFDPTTQTNMLERLTHTQVSLGNPRTMRRLGSFVNDALDICGAMCSRSLPFDSWGDSWIVNRSRVTYASTLDN
jgi:hypothetical protein